MTAETDAEFVERISRAIYDSNSTHKDADLIRLFDLARRGAAAADRIAQLEAALRPFAESAKGFDSYNIKNPEEWFCYGGVQGSGETTGAITVGDLRRARAALEERT